MGRESARIQIIEKEARHILSKSKLPGLDFCVNPYVGCEHACVYCYACFMRKFTGHENDVWGQFVSVKTNGVELFRHDCRKLHWNDSLFFGSVTDAYQPVERDYQITRGMLEILSQNPEMYLDLSILTKSDLVVRDIDLLKKLPNISVGFSIAMLDEKAREIFEPGATSISRRLDALRTLADAGLETFVFIGPILPGITPLADLFARLAGITGSVHGESLNCNCGNLPSIRQAVMRYKPELLSDFCTNVVSDSYWSAVEEEFYALSARYNIPVQGFYRHGTESEN
ncbi:MAG: radical SAM protein [Planctomycetia bacterium]|nr:radical SAM protein [Planctomycetia bacterium]